MGNFKFRVWYPDGYNHTEFEVVGNISGNTDLLEK